MNKMCVNMCVDSPCGCKFQFSWVIHRNRAAGQHTKDILNFNK